MKLAFGFSDEHFIELCVKNTQRKKSTVIQDIHDAFLSALSSSVDPKSQITNIKHSSKSEYHDKDLSLIDYFNNGYIDLYYPKIEVFSEKDKALSIEEVVLPNFIKLNKVSYGSGVTKTINIKVHNLKTKNKFTVEFLHLRIGKDIISKIIDRTNETTPCLLPSRLGVWEWRQTFYNKITGEAFFCKCFETAIQRSGLYVKSNCHQHIKIAINGKSFKESICHLCTNTNSDLFYCSPMYGSAFRVRYGAYIKKVSIENEIDEREAEDVVREKKGVAKIGERWINETLLYNYIDILFPQYTVEREASPSWLGKQRLDIYIPDISLGVEYQGEQHFKVVDHFGGEEGLERTKERDKEKLQKCKRNKVALIYFSYKDNLSEKLVEERLKSYLEVEYDNAKKTGST